MLGQAKGSQPPMSVTRTLLIITAALLVVTLGSSAFAQKVPPFHLKGDNSRVYRAADYRGHYLVIYLFSPSCPHCERSLPFVNQLWQDAAGRFSLLGISLEGSRRNPGSGSVPLFPVAFGSYETGKDFAVNGTPFIWIVDPQGNMKERLSGDGGGEQLLYCMDRLIDGRTRGLYEVGATSRRFVGKKIRVAGNLLERGRKGAPPYQFVSNGIDLIRVIPRQPGEAASLKRDKLSAGRKGNYVVVTGTVAIENAVPLLKDAYVEVIH